METPSLHIKVCINSSGVSVAHLAENNRLCFVAAKDITRHLMLGELVVAPLCKHVSKLKPDESS